MRTAENVCIKIHTVMLNNDVQCFIFARYAPVLSIPSSVLTMHFVMSELGAL